MNLPNRILIFQTAFLGDVILTLPLAQVLHRHLPDARIDFLTTPNAAAILRNHPAIHSIIVYDKRNSQRGIGGMFSVSRIIKENQYDAALVPHRSFRSAVVVALSGIPIRAGFDTSAGRFLFTNIVRYEKNNHEIERNLALAAVMNVAHAGKELPSLYPSQEDVSAVDRFFSENSIDSKKSIIAVAPGSVWNTKRWLSERFSDLVKMIVSAGMQVILIGGKEDEKLCGEIAAGAAKKEIFNSAGALTILQSAELIRRCAVLVTNDSAPMHLAVAMRTAVVGIFGATVPAFGFAPYGERDVVVQTEGLSCRPCSIHGGDTCPIGTFECMTKISAETVFENVMRIQRNA